ncbi:MAG: hypothetical protein WA921_05135 [Ahrensia sp.]
MSNFRYRNISTVIDTTDVAEFDIADNRLSDAFLEKVAGIFVAVPYSNDDICFGNLRARTIEDFDFFFIVGRIEDKLVVTIGGVQRHQGVPALTKALAMAEKFAMLRGITGL